MLQRAESQAIRESLCISFIIVLGRISNFYAQCARTTYNHTPYQALLGRQPHLLQALEGGYRGEGYTQNAKFNTPRVRGIVVVAIIEATARQRFVRGGGRNQIASRQMSEHEPGYLVDIWYDPPHKDTPGWGGPAQVVSVNDGEGNITVWVSGEILDRRHQEFRARIP